MALAAAAFIGFRVLTSDNSTSQAAGLSSSSSGVTGTPATTSTAVTPSTTTTSAASAQEVAAQKAMQECAARAAAAQPVIATAGKGAQDWSAHVQGQNDIDSGARSLIDVKTNTWGPTRAAGPGDVAAYQAAVTTYATAAGCQNVAALSAPADLQSRLDACAQHQAALDAYVETAKAVMADWQTHLGEMADRAEGHINSVQAQENWLKRWREAPAHLVPFNQAAAALTAAPDCTV